MPENANAHDCDDCLPDCEHPDHMYEGDDIDIELIFTELREMALRQQFYPLVKDQYEDLRLPDPEGPVAL